MIVDKCTNTVVLISFNSIVFERSARTVAKESANAGHHESDVLYAMYVIGTFDDVGRSDVHSLVIVEEFVVLYESVFRWIPP